MCACHSAIPGIKGNAGGHLGDAGSATIAATKRESIPRLTALFPTQLDLVLTTPPLGERGAVLKGQWHFILDLSTPEGQGAIDSIPKPQFTVQYVSADAFIDSTLG